MVQKLASWCCVSSFLQGRPRITFNLDPRVVYLIVLEQRGEKDEWFQMMAARNDIMSHHRAARFRTEIKYNSITRREESQSQHWISNVNYTAITQTRFANISHITDRRLKFSAVFANKFMPLFSDNYGIIMNAKMWVIKSMHWFGNVIYVSKDCQQLSLCW